MGDSSIEQVDSTTFLTSNTASIQEIQATDGAVIEATKKTRATRKELLNLSDSLDEYKKELTDYSIISGHVKSQMKEIMKLL